VTDAVSLPWLARLRGEVLRHIRAQGSTQAALAAHLGITEKHMSQVLTGRVNGSPEMIDRIAGAVGLRIALVAGEGDPVALPPGAWRGRPKRKRAEREGAAP
jgi:transcriptional regulator with XRE-family HTH domain